MPTPSIAYQLCNQTAYLDWTVLDQNLSSLFLKVKTIYWICWNMPNWFR